MNVTEYQNRINDVITKCPLEAGIEHVVFSFLEKFVQEKNLSIICISSLHKNRDSRLENGYGISDLAIVTNDFEYQKNTGKVLAFIEVKFPKNDLPEKGVEEGIKSTHIFIYTNALIWKIYKDGKLLNKTIDLRKESTDTTINEEKYNELCSLLKEINLQE